MERQLTRIILIFMISGPLAGVLSETTAAAVTTATIPKYAFYMGVEITNRVFNNSLRDPESAYYKSMYEQVSGLLQLVYNCSTCWTASSYLGVAAMNFRNGSVIANSTIVFQTVFINAILVKNLLTYQLPATNELNGLVINPNFTEEVVTPIPAALPTSTYTTTTTPLIRTTSKPANGTTTVTSKPTSTNTGRNSTMSPSTKPGGANTTTTTTTVRPITSTTRSNSTSKAYNTSTSTTKTIRTEAILKPSTGAAVTGGGGNYRNWVPGWAIALLVLACIILLLLIILLILAIIRLCCRKKKQEPEAPLETYQHTPYERTTFKEPLSTPSYSPQTPLKSPVLSAFEDPAKPKANRTGMYVVNPDT